MSKVMVGQVYKSVDDNKRRNRLRTLRVERVGTPVTMWKGRLKDGVRYAWCVSNVNGVNGRIVAIEEKRLLSKDYEIILQPATITHEANI